MLGDMLRAESNIRWTFLERKGKLNMRGIQKITDERLILKNMKNIRFVYTFQTLGILSLIGYQFISGGIDGIMESPLWIVFIASTIILALLSPGADERLEKKNLQKIRLAFAIQMVGVVAILGYDYATLGMDGMKENPLWIIFTLTGVLLAYFSMNMSVEHEKSDVSSKKGLLISVLVLTVITIVVGVLTTMTEGFTVFDGALMGGILFVCGIVPILLLFKLRNKSDEE